MVPVRRRRLLGLALGVVALGATGVVAAVVVSGDGSSADADANARQATRAITLAPEGEGTLFRYQGVDLTTDDVRTEPDAYRYAVLIDEDYVEAQERNGASLERLRGELLLLANRLGPLAEAPGAPQAVVVSRPRGDAERGLGTGILVFNTTDRARTVLRVDVILIDAAGHPATESTRFLDGASVTVPPRTAFFFGAVFPPHKVIIDRPDFMTFSTASEVLWEPASP